MAVIKKGTDEDVDDDVAYNLNTSTHVLVPPREEGDMHPWEWTIVLGHIHRHTGSSPIKEDAMKLAIHGLKDNSDHDAQDWDDALAVVTSTLSPIALRLAQIREELHGRRRAEGCLPPLDDSFQSRIASSSHRHEIICIGYNEMFPAVLALADAVGKEVVAVEYDPMKLRTVQKLYCEEKRRSDFREERNRMKMGKSPLMETVQESKSNDDINGENDIEFGTAQRAHMGRVQSVGNLSQSLHASSTNLKPQGAKQPLGGEQRSSSGNLKAMGGMQHSSSGNLKALCERRRTVSGDVPAFDTNQSARQSRSRLYERRNTISGDDTNQFAHQSRSRLGRIMSTPTGSVGRNGFWALQSSSFESDGNDSEEKIKGVKCEYADIHDPESWEELEIDHACQTEPIDRWRCSLPQSAAVQRPPEGLGAEALLRS